MARYGRSRGLTDEELYLEFIKNAQATARLQEPRLRETPLGPMGDQLDVRSLADPTFLEDTPTAWTQHTNSELYASPDQQAYRNQVVEAGRFSDAEQRAIQNVHEESRKRAMEVSDRQWNRILDYAYNPENAVSDEALGELATQFAAQTGARLNLPNPVRLAGTKAGQNDPSVALAEAEASLESLPGYTPSMKYQIKMVDGRPDTSEAVSASIKMAQLAMTEKKMTREDFKFEETEAVERVEAEFSESAPVRKYGSEYDAWDAKRRAAIADAKAEVRARYNVKDPQPTDAQRTKEVVQQRIEHTPPLPRKDGIVTFGSPSDFVKGLSQLEEGMIINLGGREAKMVLNKDGELEPVFTGRRNK